MNLFLESLLNTIVSSLRLPIMFESLKNYSSLRLSQTSRVLGIYINGSILSTQSAKLLIVELLLQYFSY